MRPPTYLYSSGAAASYISYNFARGGHCGSNILYSPIEEQKRACSPIFAIECPKILKNIQHAMQKKSSFLSTLCLYGDIGAISSRNIGLFILISWLFHDLA